MLNTYNELLTDYCYGCCYSELDTGGKSYHVYTHKNVKYYHFDYFTLFLVKNNGKIEYSFKKIVERRLILL